MGGPTVGGLNMSGVWTVAAPITGSTFTFVHTGAASSTTGPTGSATLQYLLQPGTDNPIGGYGWGAGVWGQSTWGTRRSTTKIFIEPTTWSLDHFGSLLIANQSNGPINSWDPTQDPIVRATPFPTNTLAPLQSRYVFVTPERFIIALGCSRYDGTGQDNLNMRWCNQNDPLSAGSWGPSTTGTAGERRLTEGKKIIAGTPLASETSLIWTDTTLYTHQFTGSTFIFNTQIVASEAGLIGPHAFTRVGGSVYWLGNASFQVYSGGVDMVRGSGDVSDWVFENLRSNYGTKTVCFYVPRYNEVWWIVVTGDAEEPITYAAVNLADYSWITGSLQRTAACRQPDADYRPLLADALGNLWTHETGVDANGYALESFIKSGVVAIGEGQSSYEVTGMVPDFERIVGQLDVEVTSFDRPNSPNPTDTDVQQVAYGDGLVDFRIQGRLLAMMIRSKQMQGDFRCGKHQFEIVAGGARR